ncbi:hypothetical protein C8A01DRAFT_34350 [Parachaetomium inaequale]|uniref:Uncharacterized protein n=1 Tax=Parachaetomium inaequale TaxID=2588326 RepID=A0AAN6PML6_9PEZI|nr:hypothetical protein C8A01DRAFT_34350 [Parachaetomium inaequale]
MAFAGREWEFSVPQAAPPSELVPSSAPLNYSDPFDLQLRLYHFAKRCRIPNLEQLILHKLYHTLMHLKPYRETLLSVTGLVPEVLRLLGPQDRLRGLWASYCACVSEDLRTVPNFGGLYMTVWSEFVPDVMEKEQELLSGKIEYDLE